MHVNRSAPDIFVIKLIKSKAVLGFTLYVHIIIIYFPVCKQNVQLQEKRLLKHKREYMHQFEHMKNVRM